ncbi:putative ferric reductase transmembrane component 3 [Amylocarpus encephaloides]|uniref:Ferric reductase transmembrane component 3 n=1 Tax=Amylocarpus encephaloides TaxID=45428 RepID=A0A9P7YB84_9HELO|nr:putative ferric reductase transmembrane component 3 [Amylocarpus encephaloides]
MSPSKATTIAQNATNNTTGVDPAATIAPYATALNGVSQEMNFLFKNISWWNLGILGMIILTIRVAQRAIAHSRHMGALGLTGEQQAYWAMNRFSWWWKFKRHMLYAPLKNKRHNRQVCLSKLGNLGTIPSRFHSILITIFLLTNFGFCAWLNYNRPNKWSIIAELRGRTGVMTVVNMIPLIIFAGRNNPLIGILQISFDTYNLMHRWIGRMAVLEAAVHTLCWAIVKYAATGWNGLWTQIRVDPFAGWGMVATTAMIILAMQSLSSVRHAFYETFLNIHIIMAFAAFLGTYIHCKVDHLPQEPWLLAVFILWLAERLARFVRLVYYNWAFKEGWTNVTVQAMPGEAIRVIMHLPKKVDIHPGSHAYIRFAGINPWESHPFSIAWVDHKPKNASLPTSEKEGIPRVRDPEMVSDVSFVIQAQQGMTRKLYEKAFVSHASTMVVKGAFEGPYGGHHSLDSYGHCVLVAGASGITHQIPYVRHLLKGYNDMTVATRKITLIWVIRDSEHLEWVRPWMDQILGMPKRRDMLTIKLFVTRPNKAREIISPSATVQMSPARPNLKLLMESECRSQKGAMCVTVCGPGGLADNVREVVRNVQDLGVVDFIEESFTW